MTTSVKLRGHHLLCILSYIGKGYTEDFVARFDDVVGRINRGAPIEIVSGVDALCSSLRRGAGISCDHAKVCRKQTVTHRDRVALQEVARALRWPYLNVGDNIRLTPYKVNRLRRHFIHGAIRQACRACPWHQVCTDIASTHFNDTKLMPSMRRVSLSAGKKDG